MAAAKGKKTSSSRKNSGKSSTGRKKDDYKRAAQDHEMFHEIGLIVLFLVMVFLFCCNFGIIGPVGDSLSGILFGIFGFTAYIAPIMLFVAIAFWFANAGNPNALRKLTAGVVLFLMLGVTCELFAKNIAQMEAYDVKVIYTVCRDNKSGGGMLAGSITYFLHHYLETIGTILVVLLFSAISIILLTEKSLIGSVKSSGIRLREKTREDAIRRREYAQIRRDAMNMQRSQKEEERRLRAEEKKNEKLLRIEEKENEKILRMEKKVSGVMLDTSLKKEETENRRDDIHEITYLENQDAYEAEHLYEPAYEEETLEKKPSTSKSVYDFDSVPIRIHKEGISEIQETDSSAPDEAQKEIHRSVAKEIKKDVPKEEPRQVLKDVPHDISGSDKKVNKTYMFPPLSRLQKGTSSGGDSAQELKETAMRLQQTLHTFGVKVTITDISQGPSVTRYELQPEQGVKVSKIVGLADDIKLNLAATDIRIEAPIPGKAAIGIEVPNKENMMVALRDLLESKEFREFPSNLAFAVGKDIAGKTIVADIAKMPHVLIAGATGSGKSVCINTLIMSILYKAHPDDVKLIMVDPKVVELSVYNGIPHLLIPVVTDPKKASAALHWGVTEMEERYKRFADFNVRDLKGYNKKLETMLESGEENVPAKMPQIVIIVDELADLMMVSPGEVEESICRLAQLARAAGIHLIIATQRPSVDVITGLIKANMPSRVAFAVASGVDSRTILDMNGAEKLLGKGDMLFYPQGYSKPARIQGAFVSDKEVSDVVDFLKNQTLGNTYVEEIEEKIKNIGNSSGNGASSGNGNESSRDEYFEEAGRFIIDKDKASIGMLQRVLKIGFNRAARIMDQLCEYGVVGEEEGTKPRKVLMSMEQFEQLLEEIV